jgi:hypothetical protein
MPDSSELDPVDYGKNQSIISISTKDTFYNEEYLKII